MNMLEINHIHNNKLNIPLNLYLKEKEKYLKYSKKTYEQKRYLFNNFEGLSKEDGSRICYNKQLVTQSINDNRLSIEWVIQELQWPQDIQWMDTEEYLCEEFNTDEGVIQFITTKKGFRRILIKK